MKITFWGGTESVTGSMSIIESGKDKIIVDCGMFQGLPDVEVLNELPFPFDASTITDVILTHAHLDHCGLLPRLVKEGFQGKIYATKGTIDLAKIVMKDAASISDQFYEESDVENTIHRFRPAKFLETVSLKEVTLKFIPAGHILGASSVKITANGKSVVFSGDVGRSDDHLLKGPGVCPEADMVILESTYGNRVRSGNVYKELHSFLMDISRNKKIGLIASFAIARGQLLLSLIYEFFERHPEDSFPVYVDSPMMLEACRVYKAHADETLKPEDLPMQLEKFEKLEHVRQWESLKKKDGPILILGSSGMMSGGRILRHFSHLQDRKDAVLFLPGYQGEGTIGKKLIEGERSFLVNGSQVFWKGGVIGSSAFSSHADQNELMTWAKDNKNICLIHGEQDAKMALKEKLENEGKSVLIPVRGQSITL